MNAKVAKAVAEEGGISVIVKLARSANKLVAEEAAGGLWNLSVGEEYKVSFWVLIFFLNLKFFIFSSSDISIVFRVPLLKLVE